MKRLKARLRLFHIWQLSGSFGKEAAPAPEEGKGFFEGSFDSIPFLNEDAKRTFVHLLLRPGYMIRDYIRGRGNAYLAPLTSLIIFYAFLALVGSVASPVASGAGDKALEIQQAFAGDGSPTSPEDARIRARMESLGEFASKAYVWMHLDSMPQEVDTRLEKGVAGLETALRSRGVSRFLGRLLVLSLCIWIVLRKRYRFSFSASATTAAYILCQFCFFMIFTLFLSLGRSDNVSTALTAALLLVDFHQLLGISWKRSLVETLKVLLAELALFVGAIAVLLLILVIVVAGGGA